MSCGNRPVAGGASGMVSPAASSLRASMFFVIFLIDFYFVFILLAPSEFCEFLKICRRDLNTNPKLGTSCNN
jgi:hypothetical protein